MQTVFPPVVLVTPPGTAPIQKHKDQQPENQITKQSLRVSDTNHFSTSPAASHTVLTCAGNSRKECAAKYVINA